jgi:FKBP-type peptidyl-prolyl cis-trans isomerase SlpA
MIIPLQIPSGKVFTAIVLEITLTTIIVDFNHPLAGQVLIFEVTIVAINDETY